MGNSEEFIRLPYFCLIFKRNPKLTFWTLPHESNKYARIFLLNQVSEIHVYIKT